MIRVTGPSLCLRLTEGVGKAARAGEWGKALDVLLAALTKNGAPVSPAERDELAAMLDATWQPDGEVAKLSISHPGADNFAPSYTSRTSFVGRERAQRPPCRRARRDRGVKPRGLGGEAVNLTLRAEKAPRAGPG